MWRLEATKEGRIPGFRGLRNWWDVNGRICQVGKMKSQKDLSWGNLNGHTILDCLDDFKKKIQFILTDSQIKSFF